MKLKLQLIVATLGMTALGAFAQTVVGVSWSNF